MATANGSAEKLTQRTYTAARSVVGPSSPKSATSGCANAMHGTITSRASPPHSQSEVRVTRSASSRSPAPHARATRAIVPVVTAISTTCCRKKMRPPTPVAEMAAVPSWRETTAVPTSPTADCRKFVAIAGRARAHTRRVVPVPRLLLPGPSSLCPIACAG
jgi:hypothetical protein